MADTVLTTDIVAKEALMILNNELGVMKTWNRDYESEYSKQVNGFKVGETVRIRRPADFTIRQGAVASAQDVIEGRTTLTVDKQRGVDFDFSSADLTLDVSSISERFIKPAMINLANDVVRDCFDVFYKGVYNWVGTPGQTINSYADFSKGPERLDELAVPMAMRASALSPSDHWAMLGAQTNLNQDRLVGQAFTQGSLGNIGGVETYMSQVVPTHTVGDHGGTPLVDGATQNVTYDTAKNTWSQTLITDGWATSQDLLAGDVFTIAGVNMVNPKTKADTGILQQFVVGADVTTNASAAADTTLTISPPIISSGPHQTVTAAPADNAAITYAGTANTAYKQNLFYHRDAFALAVVPMEIPPGSVDPSRQTEEGISIRVIPVYDGTNDVSLWRLDLLYGCTVTDPRIATRASGTA